MRLDLGHLVPGHAHAPAAPHDARDPAYPSSALRPGTRPDADRGNARGFAGPAFEFEIVDVAAASPVAIEDLVVEDLQCDVDFGQFWPTFVRIISGIAVNATTMMTAR